MRWTLCLVQTSNVTGRDLPIKPIIRAGTRRPGLTEDAVEKALAQIRHIARVSSLQLALDVGEVVFETIFDGDAAMLRSRGPKHTSFRRLALHPELPMSASNLWRAVAIFELSRRLPDLPQATHLGVCHVRAVLGLPPHDQEQLLARAESERWDVSRLETQASVRRRGRGGRPRKLEVLKALDKLRAVAALPLSTFADKRAVRRMSGEEVDVALETLNELSDRFDALRELLLDARRHS